MTMVETESKLPNCPIKRHTVDANKYVGITICGHWLKITLVGS
jgi:hypothetical protein